MKTVIRPCEMQNEPDGERSVTFVVTAKAGSELDRALCKLDWRKSIEIEIPDPPKTPGQIAYEAHREACGESRTRPDWQHRGTTHQKAWEAAAQAVLDARGSR